MWRAPFRLLSEQKAGILEVNSLTLDLLKEKHPDGEPVFDDLLLKGKIPEVQSVIFDEMEESVFIFCFGVEVSFQ